MNPEEKRVITMVHLITCDDEILSGTPVFKNTRVPIKNLIDYLEAGDNFDEFLDDFPSVRNLEYQQNLSLFDIAVVVFVAPNNRLETLQPLMPKLHEVLKTIQFHEVVHIGA